LPIARYNENKEIKKSVKWQPRGIIKLDQIGSQSAEQIKKAATTDNVATAYLLRHLILGYISWQTGLLNKLAGISRNIHFKLSARPDLI